MRTNHRVWIAAICVVIVSGAATPDWEAQYYQAKQLQEGGKYAEAERLYRRLLASLPETDSTAWRQRVWNNLGAIRFAQGRLKEAEELFRKAAAAEGSWVKDRFRADRAAAMGNLAAVLALQARFDEDESVQQQGLALLEQEFGRESPRLANGLLTLAELKRARGEYRRAEEFNREVADRLERHSLEHTEAYVRALDNLAASLAAQGRYEEVEAVARRALAVGTQHLGAGHSLVAIARAHLAEAAMMRGRAQESEVLFHQAIQELEATQPAAPWALASSLNNLAQLYRNTGRFEAAEPLYRRALELWGRILGPDHPDVAKGLRNLGQLFAQQGKLRGAERLFRQALGILERSVGTRHPEHAAVVEDLMRTLQVQGRRTEAARLGKGYVAP